MRALLIIFFFLFTSSLFSQPQPCGENPQMTSTCADACVICDIDGFTGVNDLTASGQGFNEFCTTQYNNMQYLAFVAGTTSLTIQVDVGTCTGGINSLEVGFFESSDCENFTPISPCDTDIPSNTSQEFTTNVELTIGQYYYLVIDGSNGANCSWTFNVIDGSTLVSPLTTSGEITAPLEICPEALATFSTTEQVGASNYEWTIDGDVQSNSNSGEVDLDFPGDGTFEVCVLASNVCNEAPPSCITVVARTPGDLFIDEEICENECIMVNGIEYCETGIFQDIITLPSGCDSTINIDLVVLETALTDLSALICNDDFFEVGETSFNMEGIHEVIILTADECDSVVTLDLTVIECEIILSPQEIPVICNGTATGTLVFSVDQGEPPLTWTYTNLEDGSITGTGMTNLLVDNEIPNVPVGLYNIYVSDNFGNDAVVVQEVTEPPVLVSEITPSLINGFNISCFETNGMPGDDGTLSINVNGGVPSYSYVWSNGDTGPMAEGLLAETYTVTITDDVGCIKIDSFTLTAPPPIDPIINFIDPDCSGLETGQVLIEDVFGGTPPYNSSLNGSPFQATISFDGLEEGVYEIQILDGNGCIYSEQSEIFAPEIPVILALEDLTVSLGCEVVIQPELNITEFGSIDWFDSSTLDCEDCINPTSSPFNTTTYTLVVSSVDSCFTEGSLVVSVEKDRSIYIPNVFTPNSDALNDKLTVYGGKQVEKIVSFIIYDRWGELVFKAEDFSPNDLNEGWDGLFKGKQAMGGIYAYLAVVEYLDGEQFSFPGEVLIMR